jgi:hypothetical protein
MKAKQQKPSKRFVKEMEKMYPQGATITPTKTKAKPKAKPVKK